MLNLKLTKKNSTNLKKQDYFIETWSIKTKLLFLIDLNLKKVINTTLARILNLYIGEFVWSLCIILSQMSRFIKHFDGGRRNMSFLSVNGEIIKKFNKIWKQTINTYGHELDSQPVFDKKYMKSKLKNMLIKSIQTMKLPKKKFIIFAIEQFVLIPS